jgi:hypothetical protein
MLASEFNASEKTAKFLRDSVSQWQVLIFLSAAASSQYLRGSTDDPFP